VVGFEYFEHAADVGVRGFGASPEEAFEGAARALFRLVSKRLVPGGESGPEEIHCEASDVEELLVSFLNELISVFDAKRLVFGRFELTISQGPPARLQGRAWGQPFDPERHESTVDPKGATYTALRVARDDGRWTAQCVVDV
jgi:SHS2 domain-containing protein